MYTASLIPPFCLPYASLLPPLCTLPPLYLPFASLILPLYLPYISRMCTQVKRHTRLLNKPLWEHRLILIPINTNDAHWTLAAVVTEDVTPTTHTIRYYDSLTKRNTSKARRYLDMIQKYLEQERKFTCDANGIGVVSKHKYIKEISLCPQQNNGYDCGVFVCMYAYCMCMNIPVDTFLQRNAQFFRRHITLSIAQGRLTDIVVHTQDVTVGNNPQT